MYQIFPDRFARSKDREAPAWALEQRRMEAGMRIGVALLKRSSFDVVAIHAGTEVRRLSAQAS